MEEQQGPCGRVIRDDVIKAAFKAPDIEVQDPLTKVLDAHRAALLHEVQEVMKELESRAAPAEIEKGTTCVNNLTRASNHLRIVSKRKLEMQMQIDEIKEELRQRYEDTKVFMTQIEEAQQDERM